MFYEPQTLIIVYKDEMLANQMKKMIETKDDTEDSVTGTRDSSCMGIECAGCCGVFKRAITLV